MYSWPAQADSSMRSIASVERLLVGGLDAPAPLLNARSKVSSSQRLGVELMAECRCSAFRGEPHVRLSARAPRARALEENRWAAVARRNPPAPAPRGGLEPLSGAGAAAVRNSWASSPTALKRREVQPLLPSPTKLEVVTKGVCCERPREV